MNCKQFRENIVAYLRDELSKKEKAEMIDHVEGPRPCAKCKEEFMRTEDAMNLASAAADESVKRIVSTYIQHSLRRGASDMHFEARRGGVLTARCRVDGVLVDLDESLRESSFEHPEDRAMLENADRALGGAVISRLKVMAHVDLAEPDTPQYGSVPVRWEDRDYSLVASFMPVADGDDAVVRILPREAPLSLESAGISEQAREAMLRLASQPMGLILVSGPSGSGKTTVVLSLAQHLAGPQRKVVTIEDPVFPRMEHATQLEVADHKGMTTAALVSRVIRLDPDVVAVHLISDADVASKCAALALEGTLVIAAFHANDAASAIWGYRAMLEDRALAPSCVVGATNQRLVRQICPDCREAYTPSPQALESLALDPSAMKFEHGRGCEKCRNTGYFGRTAIVEVLEMTQELWDLLPPGTRPDIFEQRLREAASPTLTQDATRKVMEGITTAEEACRVIPLAR